MPDDPYTDYYGEGYYDRSFDEFDEDDFEYAEPEDSGFPDSYGPGFGYRADPFTGELNAPEHTHGDVTIETTQSTSNIATRIAEIFFGALKAGAKMTVGAGSVFGPQVGIAAGIGTAIAKGAHDLADSGVIEFGEVAEPAEPSAEGGEGEVAAIPFEIPEPKPERAPTPPEVPLKPSTSQAPPWSPYVARSPEEIDILNAERRAENERLADLRAEEERLRDLELLAARESVPGARTTGLYRRRPTTAAGRFRGRPPVIGRAI